jgi:hypothetical protein
MLESPEGQLQSHRSRPADHKYPTGKEKNGIKKGNQKPRTEEEKTCSVYNQL